MLQSILRSLAALALAAGLVGTVRPAAAQRAPAARPVTARSETPARLDQLMARWELDATGVSRLSAAERRAFEAWLGRYTAALRANGARGAAPTAAPALTGPAELDTIRPAPGSRPAPMPGPSSPAPRVRIALTVDPTPAALEIVAVYENGDLVATEDGSLWETSLRDRPSAAAWQVGQSVVVRANPLPTQLSGPPFDVVLLNGEMRTAVVARYAGRQAPAGAAGSAGGPGGVPGAH